MKFVFPIQTSNGKEFANAKEFEKILKQETIGQYGFNPSHSTFHGGVHFTKKNAPWVRNQYPIRAVADGKIVACRLNYDYPETTYDGRTLPFSNDFCLIEHEFDYKDESDQNKTFVFYSLYMHLAAIGDKKTEIEEEPIQHVLAQSWFGRAMPRIEEPANTYVKLRKGTVLILDEEAGPVECINGEQTLIFRKYTIQDNRGLIDSLTTVGNTLWLADDPTPSEQQPQFNIKGGPVKTSQEPTWFYQKLTAEVIANDYINVRSDPSSNGESGDVIGRALTGCTLTLERKRALKFYTINGQKYLMAKCEFKNGKAFKNDTANSPLTLGWVAITDDNIKITGKTDALDFNSDANPVTETSISIRAGEPIGYLGRFDVLENDAEKGYVVTTRYQLHHELISLEKPPQAFLKAYYGDEKAESLQFASDNESHGYLLENGLSDFFRNLALCAKRSEVPCEEREGITVEDEQVLSVLTPEAASQLTVVQHTSEWYHKSDTSFLFKELDRIFGVNDRLQHEKDRADQLAWMQNTSIFSDSSAVWNWWPINGQSNFITNTKVIFQESNVKNMFHDNHEHLMFLTMEETLTYLQSTGWKNTKSNWVEATESDLGTILINYGLNGKDVVTTSMLIAQLKTLNIKASVVMGKQGKRLIKFTGYKSVSKLINTHTYMLDNPKIIQMGIGEYGVVNSVVNGLKLSIYVSAAYRFLDFWLNDETSLTETFGRLGVDIAKIALGSAVTAAITAGSASLIGVVTVPLVVTVVVGFGAAVALNALDEKYGVTDYVVDMIERAEQDVVKKSIEIKDTIKSEFIDIGSMFLDGMLEYGKTIAINELNKYIKNTIDKLNSY